MKIKNKKAIISIIVIIILGTIYLCLFFRSKNSIIGEWKIDSFIFDGKTISFNEYGQYYGTDNEKAYSYFSVTFKKNNVAIITMPAYEQKDSKQIECTYNISNNVIALVNEKESIDAFTINRDTLETLNSDFLMEGYILKKQQ